MLLQLVLPVVDPVAVAVVAPKPVGPVEPRGSSQTIAEDPSSSRQCCLASAAVLPVVTLSSTDVSQRDGIEWCRPPASPSFLVRMMRSSRVFVDGADVLAVAADDLHMLLDPGRRGALGPRAA